MCKKCEQNGEPELGIGHFDTVHDVENPALRVQVIKLLGARSFPDWPESAATATTTTTSNGPVVTAKTVASERSGTAETVTIRTKRQSPVDRRFAFEMADTFGGSRNLLSATELGEVGGLRNFTQTNNKILELVSHNNLLLTERLKVGTSYRQGT